MTMTQRKGFTLIEILIVVAIIAILASVVLVGLGPTQQAGRDARRISDLGETQNGLELYYNKCGLYPGSNACVKGDPGGGWPGLSAVVEAAGVGVSAAFPQDPSNGKSYMYWFGTTDNANYVIGATLENANNAVFVNYVAPSVAAAAETGIGGNVLIVPADCSAAVGTGKNFCKTL